jgi:cytidyltransferase-like protein
MGTFDMLHPGHLTLLRACRNLAGEAGHVMVSVNTDEFIEEFKGKPPVQSLAERSEMLSACRYVDQVVVNEAGADAKPTILKAFRLSLAHSKFLVIGQDWALKDYYAQLQVTPEWLVSQHIDLLYVPRHTEHSTTEFKKRVRSAS